MPWFIILVFSQISFAGQLQDEAQFWHPDSFHSSYYLPSNRVKAIEEGDTVGSQLIDGMEALQRRQYQRAIDKMSPHVKRDPILAPYLNIYLSRAYLGLGDDKNAEAMMLKLTKVITSGPARINLMKTWLDLQLKDPKVSLLDLRNGLTKSFQYNTNLLWELEEKLVSRMSPSQLRQSMEYWFSKDNPKAKKYFYSRMTRKKFSSKNWSETFYVNYLKYLNEVKPQKFLQAWKEAPIKSWTRSHQKKLNAWKASSLYRTGSFQLAAKSYKALVNQGASSSAYNMLQLARSYKKNGQISSSNYWYGQFQIKFPHHTKTAEMIWTKATKMEKSGNFRKADSLYHHIDAHFSQDKRRKWATFRSALMYHQKEDYKTSAVQFHEVVEKRRGLWSSNGAMFFKGDAFVQLGQKQEAKKAFLDCIKDFPLSYYAHLSRSHLAEHQLMPASEIPTISPLFISDEDAYAWVRDKMGTQSSQDKWSPEYQQTFERLLQIGAWEAANHLYANSPSQLRWRMDFVLKYSQLYLKYGYLAESYRLARRLINKMSRKDLSSAPMQLYNVIYPTPHHDWVSQQVQHTQVDPLFVIALMRQESIFDDQIFSPVGAAGLMQIMTYTATPLAEKEGIIQRYEHDLLRNPLMAIRLGSRYLKDLHKIWEGKYEYMLANYNAGPQPTRRWKNANKGRPDKLAFEHITYWETRDYIKKVMGNYWNYQILNTYRVDHDIHRIPQ